MVSLILVLIGRLSLISADGMIFLGWTTLTVSFYLIGIMGARQKVINPDLVLSKGDEQVQMHLAPQKIQDFDQEAVINRLISEFEESKIYLNSNLTIQDVAKIIGSNRTYISAVINQKFNQNFCSFVNGFRIKELERLMLKSPDLVSVHYVADCGFGSLNSMKRSVAAITGQSFSEFRSSVLKLDKRA